MHALVLAGGLGLRMGPITRNRPKALLPLAGRMLYEYSLDHIAAVRHRLDGVTVIAPEGWEQGFKPPSWASVTVQRGPGIEAAVRAGLEEASGGEVLLSFIGYIAVPNSMASTLLDFHSTNSFRVSMLVAPVSTGVETFGFVRIGAGGRVERVSLEQVEPWQAGRGHVFAGVLAGERSAVRELASDFIGGLNRLAKRGELGALPWTGRWIEAGYPWDLVEALDVILDGMPVRISGRASLAGSAVIKGSVVIDQEAVVGEHVVIRGPAYIGRGAVLEDGAIVGPRASVEEGATVGSHSIVAHSVVMERSRVAPHNLITHSIIAEEAETLPGVYTVPGPIAGIPLPRDYADKIAIGLIAAPGARITGPGVYRGSVIA